MSGFSGHHTGPVQPFVRRGGIAIGVMAFAIAASAATVLAADVEHGRRLAEQWCSGCHLATPGQITGADDAPPFQAIANDPARTVDRLHSWLVDPHPPMPDLDLSVREIDDLTAYIISLAGQ